MTSIRVLWCWSRISGYMAAGWRALDAKDDIELKIIAWPASDKDFGFCDSLVDSLDSSLTPLADRENAALLISVLREFQPDILVLPGWMHQPYRQLARQAGQRNVIVFMGMDTPWRGTPRQYVSGLALRSFLSSVDHVVVAGERAWQYAKRLKFSEPSIHRGLYCFDENSFRPCEVSESASPSGFVFVGRLAPEKGVDVLLDSYALYRKAVSVPWNLTCIGKGPLESRLKNICGVRATGFVDPAELPARYRQHQVVILPSLYEPWGVALAEAMACGLPAIASEACGSGIDLIRAYHNGIAVATGSATELTRAMLWMHCNQGKLGRLGQAARQAALPFSAEAWARRWAAWFRAAVEKRGGKK